MFHWMMYLCLHLLLLLPHLNLVWCGIVVSSNRWRFSYSSCICIQYFEPGVVLQNYDFNQKDFWLMLNCWYCSYNSNKYSRSHNYNHGHEYKRMKIQNLAHGLYSMNLACILHKLAGMSWQPNLFCFLLIG